MLDALAIPTAFVLGCGRIGNFIDGQIVGRVTDVPWAVKFPEADGFRHPVVLYDGLKNFLLIPLLVWIRRRNVPPGRLAAVFMVLYSSLRIPIDLLREYPITLWGLPTGQSFNIVMAFAGSILLLRNWVKEDRCLPHAERQSIDAAPPIGGRRVAFAAVLAVALLIPSDATRDIPGRYGKRHPGLTYSAMYPRISGTITPPSTPP